MSIISPADLEASPLADLHALASALGIDGFRRLRKGDLVDAILTRQGAEPPPRPSRRTDRLAPAPGDAGDRTSESTAADEEGRPSRPRSRRRRGRSPDGESAAADG